MYPKWPSEELCAMLRQRVRDLSSPEPQPQELTLLKPSLLSRLEHKKQKRWEEAVNSINFSHSSCKACRTINRLTSNSGRFSRQYPISANSITLQVVKNMAHRTGDRESTRLVNKELSGLWKIPTPEGHSISEPFRPKELAAALRRLKPGKSP